MPVLRELLGVDAEDLAHHVVHVVGASGGAQHLPHDGIAPASRHVGPERLTPPVREEVGVLEIADARKTVLLLVALGLLDRVAHPHRGVGIDRAEREVFGHALDEPQGHPDRGGHRALAHRPDVPGDVELEGVDQLVAEHVIGLGQRPRHRQHDAPLEDLRDSACPLAHLAFEDVGLLEVGVAGVEDDRLPELQLVVEDLRQPRIPTLRHLGRLLHGLALLGVVVDVEVGRLQHLILERAVADLVPPEVLRLGGNGGRDDRGGGEGESGAAKTAE